MDKKNYKKKDGSKGQTFKFEAGDEAVALYDKPWHNKPDKEKGRLYDDYSIKVKFDDNEIFVKLTKTQYDQLMSHEPLKNKSIKAEAYSNDHGDFVGLRVEGGQ